MKGTETVEQLISRIAEDDSTAFEKFYNLYYSKIAGFAHYFSKSEELSGEIVSDVFYAIWQHRKKLPDIQNLDGYLYTAVKNQSLKYKKRWERFLQNPMEELPGDMLIETESPDHILITNELKRIIDQAINELPPRCKAIFVLVREEGLTYQEAAEILSISERTVHAQMIIAVKKIITSIRQYYPSISPGKAFLLFLMCYAVEH